MHLRAILLLLHAQLVPLVFGTDIIFFNDNGCDDYGDACYNIPEQICCEAGSAYGSLFVQEAPCWADVAATSFQNDSPCAIWLGSIFNLWCFDSPYYQITSGYWYLDVLNCFPDLALDATLAREKRAPSTNGTMARECRKADMHVLKDGDVLYAMKKDSSEYRTFKGLARGSEEQRAYMLANSHSSKPWQGVNTTVAQVVD